MQHRKEERENMWQEQGWDYCVAATGKLFGLVDWLVGWLVGWFVGWFVGWLVGWLIGWLVSWLVGSPPPPGTFMCLD